LIPPKEAFKIMAIEEDDDGQNLVQIKNPHGTDILKWTGNWG